MAIFQLTGFIGAKHDGSGGDNWSKTWKAGVKSPPVYSCSIVFDSTEHQIAMMNCMMRKTCLSVCVCVSTYFTFASRLCFHQRLYI